MSYFGSTEWLIRVQKGEVLGHSIVHKFGHGIVGTGWTPISSSTLYPMPTAATSLEVLSSSGSDAAAGGGATKVQILGLDSSWAETEIEKTLTGTGTVAVGTDLLRVYRMFISEMDTYATTPTDGSNVGTITLRVASAGATWQTITPLFGQTLVGCYTIPTGKTGYLLGVDLSTDSARSVDFLMQKRLQADDVTADFAGALRTMIYEVGIDGPWSHHLKAPINIGAGPCDIVCMAKGASSPDVSVDFELLLVDD